MSEEKDMNIKNLSFGLILAISIVPIFYGTALAVAPTLQLDIGGGVYSNIITTNNPDGAGIVATSNPFTLYSLMTPDQDSGLGNTYYLSVGILPPQTTSANLGSFKIVSGPGIAPNSVINVTADMVQGTPPIATVDKELATHGAFPTYFIEIPFVFDALKKATSYNVKEDAGGPTPSASGGTYYQDWVFDISGLDSGEYLHFDLYQIGGWGGPNGDKFTGIVEFAPFSHDASSDGHQVPEPGTMVLLGSGLVGLAGWGRKKFRK